MKRAIQYLLGTAFLFTSVAGSVYAGNEADAFEESYTQESYAEYSKAITVIKEVYNSASYEHNLRLGWLHYLAGLFTESTAYYQKAIKIRQYSIEAKFGYESCSCVLPAAALGNWDQVSTQYVKILEIDPQNTTANYRLGLIYYGREEYGEALPYFEKVVNLYPFGYDGLIMYAWTNLNLGKLREAKVLFNTVLLLSPNDESAKDGLKQIE